MAVHCAPVTLFTMVVAVDVGKASALLSVTDSGRQRVLGPVEFAMNRTGLVTVVDQVSSVIPHAETAIMRSRSVPGGVPHPAKLRLICRYGSASLTKLLVDGGGGARGVVWNMSGDSYR